MINSNHIDKSTTNIVLTTAKIALSFNSCDFPVAVHFSQVTLKSNVITYTYIYLLASERAQSCSCSIEISDTYVYIYIYYIGP